MIAYESIAIPAGDVQPGLDEPALLLLHNLLNDFSALAALLPGQLRQQAWLNAYLLAAGISQILDDYLHRDPYSLTMAKHLARLKRPAGPIAARAAHGYGTAAWSIRNHMAGTPRLLRWQADLMALVRQLAETVVSLGSATTPGEEVRARGEALLARLQDFPTDLLRNVVRLPSCFRSFDQEPADLVRIVDGFAQTWPDRDRALLVVGVRTSGSYLAPLLAALLKGNGYTNVQVLTLRPGQRFLPSERVTIAAMLRSGGLALLTDDPPDSGNSLSKAAGALEQVGFSSQSIVLLLQLFGRRDSLPPVLQRYPAVLLPWEEWTVHQKLTPAAVRSALAGLLNPAAVPGEIERLPLPFISSAREHARALYRVQLIDRESEQHRELLIHVQGAGLGYFGEHSLAVQQRLANFLPQVYGLRSNLLYRAWLPEERRLGATAMDSTDAVVRRIATYTIARNRALAVDDDVSLRLVNRQPIWQDASDLMSQPFGRVAPLARPAIHRTAKRLLRVERPSVIDGDMDARQWFYGESGDRSLVKVGFDRRAFSNHDRYCYDPVFDLAGAAARCEGNELTDSLRQAYETLTGHPIDDERWLLYQVLQLQYMLRRHGSESPELHRALSRVHLEYFGTRFFADLRPATSGRLCAIDIDGVLEAEWLGYPGISPAGCRTLRALTCHGYRPVLVSGRSLDEIRARCTAFRLAGGIGEYGAVLYNQQSGRTLDLRCATDRSALDHLRLSLLRLEGVHLDPAYRYAVRAYHLDRDGRRCGLQAEMIETALAASGFAERLRPIVGERQTDFMVTGIDKGTGVLSLLAELGGDERCAGTKPLALAVGDTRSDLPMFALAELACAPANGDPTLADEGIRRMQRPYQAGLAQAASQLLGHRPGGCSRCRAPQLSVETDLLVTALAAQDTGRWGKFKQAAVLAAKVSRT